jgi:hypothetical protein
MSEPNTDDVLAAESFALNKILDELRDVHGDPVAENEHMLVFADTDGHELNEIVSYSDNNITREELSKWMHEMARKIHDRDRIGGDAWSVADPVVVLKWCEGANPHLNNEVVN